MKFGRKHLEESRVSKPNIESVTEYVGVFIFVEPLQLIRCQKTFDQHWKLDFQIHYTEKIEKLFKWAHYSRSQ